MLTQAEMIGARDDLRQAENLCAHVRGIYLSAGYIAGARLLNAILGLLADEIAVLDKAIAGGQP
jgi:hypothetical protein